MSELGEEPPKNKISELVQKAAPTAAAIASIAAVGTGVALQDNPIIGDGYANVRQAPAPTDPKVEFVEYTRSTFSEMFPNLTKDEKIPLQKEIEDFKKTTQEGGIGTLDQIQTMGELLKREYKSESGEILKFDEVLQEEAKKNGLNPNIVKGVIFIESHGRSSVESYADAVGIAQFKEEAAERYGLIVRKNGVIVEDYRDNPFMSVKAMCEYLKDLRSLFAGNLGLAVWAFHAGEGNVLGALRAHFLSGNPSIDVGDFDEAFELDDEKKMEDIVATTQRLIKSEKVNVEKVLKNPSVDEYIEKRKLTNDTKRYAKKAEAASESFEKSPLGEPTLAKAQ